MYTIYFENSLKVSANEFASIVVNASFWLGISSQPSVLEYHAEVSSSLVLYSSNLDNIRDWIDTSKCIEFDLFISDYQCPRSNKIDGYFVPWKQGCFSWRKFAISRARKLRAQTSVAALYDSFHSFF
jgi:hypothetical protein